jgi:hypothetical protein
MYLLVMAYIRLSVGDALIISHPTSLAEETKIIRMVLSNVSISISSAFSSDLISTTPFQYIKVPKDEEEEELMAQKQIDKSKKIVQDAASEVISKDTKVGENFVYRVKKEGGYGGYKIVSEKASGANSREQLLDLRSKKKSDRYAQHTLITTYGTNFTIETGATHRNRNVDAIYGNRFCY